MSAEKGYTYEDYLIDPRDLKLSRDARGYLVARIGAQEYRDPTVRRAFPLEAADRFIGLFDAGGGEIGLIEDASRLDAESRRVLEEALEKVYFRPVIHEFEHIDEEFGVVHADALTDSGPRRIEIRGIRSNIRLLSRNRAIIEDVEGNRYELRDFQHLPKLTREILGL